MFVCDKCHKVTRSGEHMTRVVVATRPVSYPPRKVSDSEFDPGGIGTEIVREEARCASCASESAS